MKNKLVNEINNMYMIIKDSPELFHDGIDEEITSLLIDIKNYIYSDKAEDKKEEKNFNKDELNNLINMMKEFDYEKNGKEDTIHFLAMMIIYFGNIDF